MNKRLHVGLTVVPTRSDFYFYLRNWVKAHESDNELVQIVLPDHFLKVVGKVEYSWRWMLRPFYYHRIADYLKTEIGRVAHQADAQQIVLYLPDDGYWAELLIDIRNKLNRRFKIVYVQHGMARLERISQASERLRRAFNKLSRFVFGWPMFGYGFGSGAVDSYVVCLPKEVDYIKTQFGTPAYAAPWFIWSKLLDYAATRNPPRSHPWRLLFAVSPLFARQIDLFRTASKQRRQYFQDIATCLQAIKKETDCEIVVRFHPNEDRQQAEAMFQWSGLHEIAMIDQNFNLADSLLGCNFVMSYASTVLLEGALIGRVPVHFVPEAYPSHGMAFRNEALRLRRHPGRAPEIITSRPSLRDVFSDKTIAEYACEVRPLDYSIQLPWLAD
jgi:hypothetical protein